MRIKLAGNKADAEIHIVKNADTVTIPRGTPLVLQLGGVGSGDDGLNVVLPSTAAGGSYAFPYGVAIRNIAPGESSEAVVYGIVRYALVGGLTRSATTANWPAGVASNPGAILQLDIVNNMFMGVAAVPPVSNYLPFAVLLDSIGAASQASVSSGTGSTATIQPVGARVFVRML